MVREVHSAATASSARPWTSSRSRRRRRRARRTVVGLVVVALVLGGAVAGVVALLRHVDDARPIVERCTAELDGTRWQLTPEQADNAATVAAVVVRRGLPAHAATIALATALQESKLRNLSYGDRDSVGLFQQRPSQGWGSADQLQHPVYATNAFLDVLVKVDGWQGLAVTKAAQRVQRSAFPDAYGQHETQSRAWASALTGHSPGAVTCTLRPVPDDVDTASDARDLEARVARDFGTAVAASRSGATVTLDARRLPGADGTNGWSVAQWAVATADAYDAEQVRVGGQVWTRDSAAWSKVAAAKGAKATALPALPSGRVAITLATPPK
ncbi:hypothetical protein ACFT5B_07485 [Luteimicrobium sp. NPDC057192]|uniref:hypothetical protein n=1 Tax=Luteimicrobium sp. NPDC057192 TaxID=3346042 RepID=UPI00363D15CB